MKAVISVTGKDNIGIIAKVASECSLYDANIFFHFIDVHHR